LRAHYQRLIALRHTSSALRTGSYQSLAATANSYAFTRADSTDRFVVALNTSDEGDRLNLRQAAFAADPLVTIGERPSVAQLDADVHLTLHPRSAAIFRFLSPAHDR
jgi:glycosidase